MSDSALRKIHMKRKDLLCPRDQHPMQEKTVGEAQLDVCSHCGGQYFDAGEMFAAFGIKADPSHWDRPETGGAVKDGTLTCPRCDTHMLGQDVRYEDQHVEIDRCGHCGGVWLDKGEVEQIMHISERLAPALEAEKTKHLMELSKLDENALSPGIIGRFLQMFHKH